MGLNRQEKAVVIEEVTARVAAAGAMVLAEYRGLEVGKITTLRKQARENGVYLRVCQKQ
jgi:large subunit ribosomal protein L10